MLSLLTLPAFLEIQPSRRRQFRRGAGRQNDGAGSFRQVRRGASVASRCSPRRARILARPVSVHPPGRQEWPTYPRQMDDAGPSAARSSQEDKNWRTTSARSRREDRIIGTESCRKVERVVPTRSAALRREGSGRERPQIAQILADFRTRKGRATLLADRGGTTVVAAGTKLHLLRRCENAPIFFRLLALSSFAVPRLEDGLGERRGGNRPLRRGLRHPARSVPVQVPCHGFLPHSQTDRSGTNSRRRRQQWAVDGRTVRRSYGPTVLAKPH